MYTTSHLRGLCSASRGLWWGDEHHQPCLSFSLQVFIDALLCAELGVSKQWGAFWGAGTGHFYRKVPGTQERFL